MGQRRSTVRISVITGFGIAVACAAALLGTSCRLTLAASAAPVWRSLGPGGGGFLRTIVVSPVDRRIVYAGCDVGGFYRSTDSGQSWTIQSTGLHDYCVNCILPHPTDVNTIYIGAESGVHESTDGGRTWRWLRNGFPPPSDWSWTAAIGALAMDPHNPEVIYAGLGRPFARDFGQGTVYRTTDGGAHWSVANPGGGGMAASSGVFDLVIDPARGSIYAATDEGLYRSADNGAHWAKVDMGIGTMRISHVALCRDHPNVMYATVYPTFNHPPYDGGVWRSDDGGATWVKRSNGLPTMTGRRGEPREMNSLPNRIVVSPTNPDLAYEGDDSWVTAGVFKTTDGGRSWRPVAGNDTPNVETGWIGNGVHCSGLAMDPADESTLYFVTSMMAFRTTDGGDHWAYIYSREAPRPAGAPDLPSGYWSTTGLETTVMYSIVVHPRDPARLFFCYWDIGLLESFDEGRSFAQIRSGIPAGIVFTLAFDPEDESIVYAGAGLDRTAKGSVCRSEDGGLTWAVVGRPETGLPPGEVHQLIVDQDSPSSARRIYAAVDGNGIYGSESGGLSWQARNGGLPSFDIRGLVQHPTRRATLFALLAGDGLYRTDDRGVSWHRVSGAFTWPDPKVLVISPSDPQRLYVGARRGSAGGKDTPGGVFASRDGGVTWRQVLDDKYILGLAADPTNADIVYAGGVDDPYHDNALGSGIRRSCDGGRTWESLNGRGLTTREVIAIALDPHRPDRIYLGTGGNGAFATDLPTGAPGQHP
jgi:photosystem II stability/assembly factor-like uncharacterized protein